MIFLPNILGYAETHYSFISGLSFLHRKAPEIITDAPWRIEPDKNIPIILLVKDADKYPIIINKIEIGIYKSGLGQIYKKTLENKPFLINKALFTKIYEISIKNQNDSTVLINTLSP